MVSYHVFSLQVMNLLEHISDEGRCLILERCDLTSIDQLDSAPTNLQRLDLFQNNLLDCSILSRFINLTQLRIAGNRIQSIEFVASLTNLLYFDFSRNCVTNDAPLQNLSRIQRLVTSHNTIGSLESLSQHHSLRILEADNCGLTNLRFAGCDLLELSAKSNQIVSVLPLSNCFFLKELHLDGNLLTDLTPLVDCTSLEQLTFSGCFITNLSFTSRFRRLFLLDASKNSIKQLGGLQCIINLEQLNLGQNRITDVRQLVWLQNLQLKQLYIDGNEICGDKNLRYFIQNYVTVSGKIDKTKTHNVALRSQNPFALKWNGFGRLINFGVGREAEERFWERASMWQFEKAVVYE